MLRVSCKQYVINVTTTVMMIASHTYLVTGTVLRPSFHPIGQMVLTGGKLMFSDLLEVTPAPPPPPPVQGRAAT